MAQTRSGRRWVQLPRMMRTGRVHAGAFLMATIVALVSDAVMRLGFDAVRVSGSDSAPWWMTANLIERGRWVAFAAVLWWIDPRLSGHDLTSQPPTAADRPEAWRQVGLAVLIVPLLWLLATWIVSALRFTWLGSWATEGRVFLSPAYYRGLVLDNAPWLMAGAALLGVRRHL